MIRTTSRIARKSHPCTYRGSYPFGHCQIKPGDRYLEVVASPEHGDLGNQGWWRMAECGVHAEFYGRGKLLDNAPTKAEASEASRG